jgi:predicted lipid-binding transport protein (Tim44 family)
MRRRRVLIIALLALCAVLVLPAAALASAGSGSSNFGGSGGGFGGGGGGGKGFIIFIAVRLLIDLIIFGHGTGALIALALVIGFYFYFYGGAKVQDWYHAQRSRGPAMRRQAKLRQRRVELAAAEAADTDAAYHPERVRAAAETLFIDVQSAWSSGDTSTLRKLVAPRLMAEWERRLDDLNRRGMTNHVELTRPPKVEYVGIGRGARTAGPAGGPDRVVVRIEARIRDWVTDRSGREINERGAPTKTVRLREYWTLVRTASGRGEATAADSGHAASLDAEFDLNLHTTSNITGGDWMLESIEQGAEGAHQLEERIVQTEWADDQALQDESLVEAANADAVPAGTRTAELTDTTVAINVDARARALDLSLADGRFAPDILEVAARRAVAAWAQAIDGETRPLLALASPDAVEQMLYPAGPGSRVVVRGPKVEKISISALDALSVPAAMTVDVKLTGRRYLQDRATAAVLAGSDIHAITFTERWTLTLSGDAQNPWQITATTSPALTR